MKLSALAMILLMTSCAASQSHSGPWKIELTTSGGFAGKGAGNYTVDSDGKLSLTTMGGRTCAFELTAGELARLDKAVDQARPDAWKESYAPENRCCDRIEYKLTLDRAGVERSTEWIDDPLPMPKDLQAIADAIVSGAGSLRVEYGPKCPNAGPTS
jgi:hypothetical protein